ncbi:sterigmatocystin 8-O-methyltransferase precursor [Trichoderma compactum]
MTNVNVKELIAQVNAAAQQGASGVDDSERKQLLAAVDKLRASYETPFETTIRVVFSGHQAIAIRLAVDSGLFDAAAKLPQDNITVKQLAKDTGVDELLVTRFVRFLTAMNVFKEPEPGRFVATPLSASYVSSSPLSAAVIHITHFLVIASQLPEYFAEKGWKSPHDVYNGPFQFAIRTKDNYFEFLGSKPYYQKAFNTVMTISHRRKGRNWFTFFPVEEKLGGVSSDQALLVDVGGSQGGDITAFQKACPNLSGKLILQDLPVVIDDIKELPAGIEAQGYDFFKEQPIKGAKSYYLRTVLHDWPDKQAVQILERVREAMTPESILLINETVIPESNAPLSSATADLIMMVSFGSLERTEKQFADLFNKAQLELVKVWNPTDFEGASDISEQASLLEVRLRR